AGEDFLLRGPDNLTLYSEQTEVLWSLPFESGRAEVSPSGAMLLVAPGMPPRAGGSVQDVKAFHLPGLEPRGKLRIAGAVHIAALDNAIVSVARGSGIYSIQVWPLNGEPRIIQEGRGHWQRLGAVSGASFVTDLR